MGDSDDSSLFTAQPTASTSSAAKNSQVDCSHRLGETPCGSICCASGQYCEFAGQCATSSLKHCESELGLEMCGSICCASWQYCASDEKCYAKASTPAKGTSSFAATSTAPASSVDSYSMDSSSVNSHPAAFSTMASSLRISAHTALTSRTAQSDATTQVRVPTTSSQHIVSSSNSALASPSSTLNDIISTQVGTTASATTAPASGPSPDFTHSPPFIGGLSGGLVLAALLFLAFFFWRKRRRQSYSLTKSEPPSDGPPVPTFNFLSRSSIYGPTQPPVPNPYAGSFPTNSSLTENSPAAVNRSRYNAALVPDCDTEDRRPQQGFRHTPPLNPYDVPSGGFRSATPGEHERWRNGPPSYMS